MYYFFFQAEDGIRDWSVTGVQTCALPILRRVVDGVRGGKSLAVFPEGTRTPNGNLQEFKPGAFKIALRAGVPIVPVTIRGTFKLLPKTTLAPRPGRVDVFIGKPIDAREYGEQRLPDLIERTRSAIEAELQSD